MLRNLSAWAGADMGVTRLPRFGSHDALSCWTGCCKAQKLVRHLDLIVRPVLLVAVGRWLIWICSMLALAVFTGNFLLGKLSWLGLQGGNLISRHPDTGLR